MGFIVTESVEIRHHHQQNRWLTRLPLSQVERLLGEPCTFIYNNTIKPGAVAGNHYHLKKHEVFLCSYGELEVTIADPATGTKETVKLSADPASPDNVFMTFPRGWVHAVKNSTAGLAVLTVFANHDPSPEDEIPFVVFS